MLSVIDVMKATEGFVRPIREGEEVLKSGLVISVGKKEKKVTAVHVQALVLRTSGLSSQHPYLVQLWVDLSKDFGSRLVNEQFIECQCPAGQSQKCKHIVAVMLYLSRVEESELDDLSCTDIEQQWGSLKSATLKEYEAKKIFALCHVKLQKDIFVSTLPKVTKEMEQKWCNRLTTCKRTADTAGS